MTPVRIDGELLLLPCDIKKQQWRSNFKKIDKRDQLMDIIKSIAEDPVVQLICKNAAIMTLFGGIKLAGNSLDADGGWNTIVGLGEFYVMIRFIIDFIDLW